MQVRFSNVVRLTRIFQGNAQRLQSKTILRHLNKNEENILHDSVFEKKEEHSLFILKQKIYLVPHLFNMDVHSYVLLPMAMEQL